VYDTGQPGISPTSTVVNDFEPFTQSKAFAFNGSLPQAENSDECI
jgi:hypothetical protein